MKKMLFALVFAAGTLFAVGCDKASSASSAAGSAGKVVADKGKEIGDKAASALETARKEVMDKIGDTSKIEEKIKGLTGDAQTKAKEKWDAFKKMYEEFKAAPMDKMGELKDKLMAAFEDLKKMVNL